MPRVHRRGEVEDSGEVPRATRLNDWVHSIWTYTRDETLDRRTSRTHRLPRAFWRDRDEITVECRATAKS